MQTANTYTKENQHTKKGKCQVNQNSKIQKWKTRQKENKENKKHTHTQRNVKWLEKVDKEERQARKENLM